jgi:4-hydroxy-tetrahydrodipicolinate synthase
MELALQTFEGIWIPLVTPFRDGRVDLAAAARLAQYYASSGVSGLIVCGTTGEAATLADEEQDQLLVTVLAAVKCPVLMGLGSYDTAAAVQRARRFAKLGAHGLLATVPYYVRPSQGGIRRHFEAIADATALPVVLYNIPYRTGVNLEIETARALAQHPRIVAIKESGGDLNQLMDLLRETPLRVLCGEDHLIFTACTLGAHGAIAAAAHVRPDLFVAMHAHLRAGRLGEARALHDRLLPMVRALFSEPNPGPIKAVLARQGWIENELRLPMTSASPVCEQRLVQALVQLG